MQEEKVTFNTAKLAKEKGFPQHCTFHGYHIKTRGTLGSVLITPSIEHLYVKCPPQSILQKWLREVHKIDIFITKVKDNYASSIYTPTESYHAIGVTMFGKIKTYEEALEEGLFYALNLLS